GGGQPRWTAGGDDAAADGTDEAMGARRGARGRVVVEPEFDPDVDPLFERLRALRKRLADERRVPAYVIFNDRTLREMCRRRPSAPAELVEVSGVGPAKLERYGAAFLEAIAAEP
ncbi:MAG TPA: HRDC domain-containing protein, partial [Longimicrobiales bacterium]|nr:HRDC domain-containing protein [Longimicrobiales bacterium]